MTVVQPDTPEFLQLVDPEATLTEIGSGYVFTEGPAWSVAEQCLYFSDIPGDKRFRWSRVDGHGADHGPDVQGQRHGLRHRRSPHRVRARHELGHPLPRRRLPRDRVLPPQGCLPQQSQRSRCEAARDGSIYFTDPDYGRWNDWIGSKREPLLGFKGVFRVPHEGGEAQLVVDPDEFDQPNGLCLSPDESLMYINDSPRAEVKVFHVADDGTLVDGRVLIAGMGGGTIGEGSVDGMECDEFGNVWVTGPGGVWVLEPERRTARHHPYARGVRQPVLGRARPAHAVPHHLDHRAHHAGAVHLRPATAIRLGGHQTMTDTARLQELEDREQIRQIFVDYGKYLDAGDHAGYASLFSDDGVFVAPLGEAVGPAAIEEVARQDPGTAGPRATCPKAIHIMNNQRIDIDGDTATTVRGVVLSHQRRGRGSRQSCNQGATATTWSATRAHGRSSATRSHG